MDSAKRNSQRTLWRVGLLGVLFVSLTLRLLYIWSSPFSYDETHNLMFAALSEQGYVPYKEVFIGIAPFALWTVRLGVKLWGTTLGVRYPMVLLGLMGIAAVYFLVARQASKKPVIAGILASVFFSFNLHYFLVSSSINLEAGALSLALLSVAVAEHYRVTPRWIWLFLSGVCLALSISIKILVPFIPLIVCAQLLFHLKLDRRLSLFERDTYVHLLKLGSIWGSGVLVVLGAFMLIYAPQLMYHQVIEFRLVLREATVAQLEDTQVTTALSIEDMLQYVPLLIGAVIALVMIKRRELSRVVIWLLWLVLALVFATSHIPLRPRHTVTILPPLAALSGIAAGSLITHLSSQKGLRWLIAVMVVLISGWTLFRPIQAIASEKKSFEESRLVRKVAIDFIQQTTAPSDCVIAKENRLNFAADRLTPPYLSEISTARIFSGLLSADEIVAGADDYDCPILVDSPLFGELIPDVRQKARSLYSLRLLIEDPVEGRKMTLYAVKMNTHKSPAYLIGRSLGGEVLLKGYDLTSQLWQRGQTVTLSMYWQAEKEIGHDYKILLSLTDEHGRLVHSYDHYPFEARPEYFISGVELNPEYSEGDPFEVLPDYPNRGLIPTRLWLPGNTLRETVTIVVPADVPYGDYFLSIGMYDEETVEQLTVDDGLAGSDQDHILLSAIQIR
jgi:hypothetical protein